MPKESNRKKTFVCRSGNSELFAMNTPSTLLVGVGVGLADGLALCVGEGVVFFGVGVGVAFLGAAVVFFGVGVGFLGAAVVFLGDGVGVGFFVLAASEL